MRPELQFTIGPDHPSLAGHFPGRPVVPGAVVLDQAIDLILRHHPGRSLATLHEVKFLSPVVPGDAVALEIVRSTPDGVSFIGKVGQRLVLRGRAGFDTAA